MQDTAGVLSSPCNKGTTC